MPVTPPNYYDTVSITSKQARDNGVDVAQAFRDAIATGRTVVVPRLSSGGYYRIDSSVISTASHVHIVGIGDPEIVADDALTGNMFLFKGNNITIEGIRFRGQQYVDHTTTINLNALLRFENSSGGIQPITGLKVLRCRFTGAQIGLEISRAQDLVLDDVYFERQRDYGCVTQYGCQDVLISNFRANEVGFFEALKLGAFGQLDPYRNYRLSKFIIKRCGRLDPNPDNWQEGIDAFAQAIDGLTIEDGEIIDCGNGGIEVKKEEATTCSSNIVRRIRIRNVDVTMDTDHGAGFVMNYLNSGSAPDLAGDVLIAGCTAKSTAATRANTYGAIVDPYTDVRVENFEGDNLHNVIRWGGTGSSDGTVRRPVARGVVGTNCDVGLNFTTGTLEDGLIQSCRFDCADGDPPIYLESGTGRILDNDLTSATDSGIRVDAGTFEITGNRISAPSTERSWKTTGSPTINAARNCMGFSAAIPTVAGALGDYFFKSAPTAGVPTGWVCTTAGNSGVAVWDPL